MPVPFQMPRAINISEEYARRKAKNEKMYESALELAKVQHEARMAKLESWKQYQNGIQRSKAMYKEFTVKMVKRDESSTDSESE